MYQVIIIFGDNRPWWLSEGWEEDTEVKETFKSFEEAWQVYEKQWNETRQNYEYINAKSNFLSAFRDDGDERWCEECDNNLQQYKGSALLKNY